MILVLARATSTKKGKRDDSKEHIVIKAKFWKQVFHCYFKKQHHCMQNMEFSSLNNPISKAIFTNIWNAFSVHVLCINKYHFTERVHTWPWGTSSFLSLSIIGIGWIPVFFISSPWRKAERKIKKTKTRLLRPELIYIYSMSI